MKVAAVPRFVSVDWISFASLEQSVHASSSTTSTLGLSVGLTHCTELSMRRARCRNRGSVLASRLLVKAITIVRTLPGNSAGTQAPAALQVLPSSQLPQLVPQAGSSPQTRWPQLGTHALLHWPAASLHVCPLPQLPQLVPQTGSSPQTRPSQAGTHAASHWNESRLQLCPSVQVPQLCPQIGSTPQLRPSHAGIQSAASHASPIPFAFASAPVTTVTLNSVTEQSSAAASEAGHSLTLIEYTPGVRATKRS